MAGTAFFFVILAALVAAKRAALAATIDPGRCDGLQRPSEID